ncbi:MAG: TonB family protein, partial [Gammaproteobacteria bacterium]|nr:TonB family protein [Gammaproteobacteria bacterium]
MRLSLFTSLGVLAALFLARPIDAAAVGRAKIGQSPSSEDFYPATSKAAGHQGKPTVRVCVNPDAQIESAEVLVSSGHEELDGAAVNIGI